MNTRTLLARAPMRIGGSFHYDTPKEGETAGGDATATIVKSIDDLGKKFDGVATKKDLETLATKQNDFAQEIKEIKADLKVGDANSLKDRMGGYKSFGEYAQAVMKHGESNGAVADDRLKALLAKSRTDEAFAAPIPSAFCPLVKSGVTKAAGDGVTQADPFQLGGIFHPQFASGLTSTVGDSDDLLGMVRYVPIDAGSESITFDYVDDADRSSGTVRGGMSAKWKSELDQMVETKPKMRQIKLEPQELYAFAYASDKSLRNSPIALGAFLQDGMRDAVRFKIGDAVVNGDGAGKPRGLLNSPNKIQASKTTSQQATTFNEDNIAKMWKRVPAQWRGNAVWLMNQDVEDQLDLMARLGQSVTALANQTGLPAKFYNADRQTINGRPIKFCEYCATLGAAGDVILWVPNRYLVAVKTGSGPEMSMHLKFDYAQTAFRFIFEIDGKTEDASVLTPYKGSVTRSSVIVLEAR